MRKKTHQFETGNGGISRKDSLMKSIVDHNFLPTSSSKSKKPQKIFKASNAVQFIRKPFKNGCGFFENIYPESLTEYIWF